MQLTEEAWFKLKFDGKPVVDALGELEKHLADVKTAQKEVDKGTKEWAENKTLIKELEAQIKSVREEMGVSGMTVKQLEGYYRQLNREIKDLTPGTEEYKRKAADLGEVNQALSNHRQTIRGVSDEVEKQPSLWDRAKMSMTAFFTVAALIEAGRMIIGFFVDSVREFRQFQSAAQDLSAVTGATGKDLDYLKQQAKEVGPAMGKSGAEMLEAYKLMASAKPELLAQKEALADITKEAIVLSQAAKMDLATAVKVTAESLNQFGEAADQANRYVNVIAAGAKEGSAEIADMGMSLKASGTVAAGANLSFEQTNAMLQSMSTIALKGEQAGTMLRNVLLKLQSGAKETNPAIVGLETALDNLAKKKYTAADMAKLFGTENVVAAQHVVAHRKEIGELTTKLTGTTEAYSQAAKNNATFDHELAKTKATLSGIKTELVEGFVPAMTKGLQIVVALVNGVRTLPGFLSENKVAFTALGLAILAFNGHLILAEANSIRLAAVEKARQIWTSSATAAQWLLNTAMTANPVGAVIAGVALLVAGFVTLYNNSLTLRAGINGLWQAMQTAATVAVSFTKAFLTMDIKGMADALMNGGKQIGAAFNKGYADQLASERPKQLAAHKAHVDQKVQAEKAGAKTIATDSVLEQQKELQNKQKAADTHRKAEEKRAAEAAKREAEEAVRANNDGLKKIEDLRIDAIKNDLDRERAKIRAKRDAEVEAMMASKASLEVKAEWEKSLNAQMIRDIERVEKDYRTKKAQEEEAARQERDQRERTTNNAVAEAAYNAHRQSLERQLSDTNLNANARKQIATQLAEVERQETLRKINDQYNAEVQRLNKEKADAIRTAQEKGQNVDQIENQFRQQFTAAESQRRSSETQAEQQFQDNKKQIEQRSLEQRKQNRKEFFDAIKQMMDGDFTAFSDYLTKKLTNEKKQLTEAQKANVAKIDAVGEYTVMAVNAITKINQMALDKQLANIAKEKNSQLAAWKDKYDKGLINKDEYEKAVDKINKEASEKEKAERLAAFKRQQKIDIAQAVINGAMAALKSLAMFGWPIGVAMAAGAAIAAAVQIKVIKNQQPPSLARGGYVRNGGVPDGPNHGRRYGESGIALVRRDSGEEVGEMEGKEPILVLSQNTYRNNRKVVDGLLHSSLHRNGAPIMRRGGIFGSDGGSYGDYLPRFDQGGWMEQADGGGGSGDSGGGGSWMSSADGGSTAGGGNDASAAEINAELSSEIDKSQQLMQDIRDNTAKMVDGLTGIDTTLANLQLQIRTDQTTQQTFLSTQLTGLRTETKTAFTDLQTANGLQSLMLARVINTGFEKLQGTMKFELPTLGQDLTDELATLRMALTLGLSSLRTVLHQDVLSLEKTTKTGLTDLQKTVHTDLTDLGADLHDDLTLLGKDVHTDLTDLTTTLEDEADVLRKLLEKEFDSMGLASALRMNGLRTQLRQNFMDLQSMLEKELDELQQATHTDLTSLKNASTAELKTVQNILSATKNEQGYQSTLLRIISEKNLTVSVQSIVNVSNQIDVVVDKSNFK